jgi:hypothetical protein
LLYTPCWLSKLSASAQGDHTSERENLVFTILPLPSPEKVCVVSFSLQAFWFCYSVWKSPGKISKKIQQKNKKEGGKKKQEDNIEGVLCVFSFLLCSGAL